MCTPTLVDEVPDSSSVVDATCILWDGDNIPPWTFIGSVLALDLVSADAEARVGADVHHWIILRPDGPVPESFIALPRRNVLVVHAKYGAAGATDALLVGEFVRLAAARVPLCIGLVSNDKALRAAIQVAAKIPGSPHMVHYVSLGPPEHTPGSECVVIGVGPAVPAFGFDSTWVEAAVRAIITSPKDLTWSEALEMVIPAARKPDAVAVLMDELRETGLVRIVDGVAVCPVGAANKFSADMIACAKVMSQPADRSGVQWWLDESPPLPKPRAFKDAKACTAALEACGFINRMTLSGKNYVSWAKGAPLGDYDVRMIQGRFPE